MHELYYLLCYAEIIPFVSTGRCWLDALELALRCSSLFRLGASKQGKDGEVNCSSDSAHAGLNHLLHTSAMSDQEFFQ